MNKAHFESLNLQFGDKLWIMTETGEGFFGRYHGKYDLSNGTFCFYNNSRGREEKVKIIILAKDGKKAIKLYNKLPNYNE